MIEIAVILGIVGGCVWLVWFVDHWRVDSTAICCSCKRLRRVDHASRCCNCYEHDGGRC